MTSLHVASSEPAVSAHTDAITSRVRYLSCGASFPQIDLLHLSIGLLVGFGVLENCAVCGNMHVEWISAPIQTLETDMVCM